ncbi:MAG: CRISPR-associated endonuclease Cas1 [Deltaproteobacteria bacterium]|nr:CRISPR-associated endonuclease Cas1 [Deltaproteobacteria bacterium]
MATLAAVTFGRWTSYRMLAGAWETVRAADVAPGVDGQRVQAFGRASAVEVTILCDELRSGRFQVQPLRGIRIPDSKKGERLVGIPALRDRIVQRALLAACEPHFAKWLHPDVHGYVRGRSTLTAQHRAAGFAAAGLRWCLHVDVADAFGTVPRDRLQALWADLADRQTASLVALFVGAAIVEDHVPLPIAAVGIPLGQPISPLCLNVWLGPVDRALAAAGFSFVRYGDDLLVLAAAEAGLRPALDLVRSELDRLGMALRDDKTRIAEIPGDPVPFLGRALCGAAVLEPVADKAPRPHDDDCEPTLEAARTRTLYVQTPGATVRVANGRARVTIKKEEVASVRLAEIDRVVLLAPATLTSPFLGACLSREIPLFIAAWPHGAFGTLTRNDAQDPLMLRAQVESASDLEFRLATAKAIVRSKIASVRWLMRVKRGIMAQRYQLAEDARGVPLATTIDQLLGIEGAAARTWWTSFRCMFAKDVMRPDHRTRRPPRDPVNSMLSFGYTLLMDEVQTRLLEVGLSPYFAYLHALRQNHPALASDLMEEFRAPVVDRLVLQACNLRQFTAKDFRKDDVGGVFLHDDARRRYLQMWEAWMSEPCWPSTGGRQLSPRDGLYLQVRRFRDYLIGKRPDYVGLFDPKGGPCAV